MKKKPVGAETCRFLTPWEIAVKYHVQPSDCRWHIPQYTDETRSEARCLVCGYVWEVFRGEDSK